MSSTLEHVFIARQPIFDREREVQGYELLYRTSFLPMAPVEDDEIATARVALSALTEVGLDRLVGDKRAWIKVSPAFLMHGHALSLPSDRVVLELLGATGDEAPTERLAELRGAGFEIALASLGTADPPESLLALAGNVKLDFVALGPEGLAAAVSRLRPFCSTIVAEKIETHEAFELAMQAGCDLFQGYFFCRPQLLRDRAITPNAVAALRLAGALQDPDLELTELERLISSDVALSYRLLRYINSAYFGLRQHIASIMHAVTLLGLENVRRWAALTSFSMVSDKPTELFMTALTRARFCQLAAEPSDGRPDELFTLGLFSVIDALTNTPIEEAVTLLPLPPRMRDSLVSRTGPGRLLGYVEAIEQGELARVTRYLPHPARDYASAVAWASETAAGIQGSDDGPMDDEYL